MDFSNQTWGVQLKLGEAKYLLVLCAGDKNIEPLIFGFFLAFDWFCSGGAMDQILRRVSCIFSGVSLCSIVLLVCLCSRSSVLAVLEFVRHCPPQPREHEHETLQIRFEKNIFSTSTLPFFEVPRIKFQTFCVFSDWKLPSLDPKKGVLSVCPGSPSSAKCPTGPESVASTMGCSAENSEARFFPCEHLPEIKYCQLENA